MKAMAAVLVLFLAACVTATPPHPDPVVERHARLYEALAFGFEFAPNDSRGERIRRWGRSVPVLIEIVADEDSKRAHRPHAQEVANVLAELTGLDVRIVPRDGNVRVHVVSSESYYDARARAGIRDDSQCFALTTWEQSAEVYISRSITQPAECWEEEILQSVTGLSNDARDMPHGFTRFADQRRAVYLTAADKIVIRAHFDPRIRVGMTKSEVGPIVRRVIAELLNR